MDRASWFTPQFRRLRRSAWAALCSLPIFLLAAYLKSPGIAVPGAILVIPLAFWVTLIPVFHWKDRYLGSRSGVWGGFLVLETSGWSKLVYWFRHVLPDYRAQGRYRDAL
jgi:hypothetical protein